MDASRRSHPFCCPDDRTPLVGAEDLRCPACGRDYPLEDGILSLLPLHAAATEAERAEVASERQRRDEEAGVYDRLPGLKLLTPWEVPLTLGSLAVGPEDRVVEIGCGTGRLTVPLAASGAEVVAVDHSRESLRVLSRRLQACPASRVTLVHGEAAAVPVCSGWATRSLAAQILEHLPSPTLRQALVAELARVLVPGGRAALSAYWYLPWLKAWMPRDGWHGGAMYFHRFHRAELRALLEPHFEVERLTGRLLYALVAHLRRRV